MTPVVWLWLIWGFADPPAAALWLEAPPTHYAFRPAITVTTSRVPANVRLILPRPADDAAQTILKQFDFPPRVKLSRQVSKDRLHQWTIAQFRVEPGKPRTFTYTAHLAIRARALNWDALPETPRELGPAERRSLGRFLERTPSTGSECPELARAAESLAAGQDSTIVIARRLYEFVAGWLTYERKEGFKGTRRAWLERRGECTDYASIYVGMCRSVGIPARPVAGFAFENDAWVLHVWAEFYAKGVGWIPCDPAHGDGTPDDLAAHFGRTDDARLALTRDFDLERDLTLKHSTDLAIIQTYVYEYEGEERPSLTWSVEGKCFGAEPPAGQPGRTPAPAARRRR